MKKLVARRLIARIAKQQGISTAQCRAEIMDAIAVAWATTDPKTKDRQIQLVGENRTPTPEELIILISNSL